MVSMVLTMVWDRGAAAAAAAVYRLAKRMLVDEFKQYHGEAINPKHLSIWER